MQYYTSSILILNLAIFHAMSVMTSTTPLVSQNCYTNKSLSFSSDHFYILDTDFLRRVRLDYYKSEELFPAYVPRRLTLMNPWSYGTFFLSLFEFQWTTVKGFRGVWLHSWSSYLYGGRVHWVTCLPDIFKMEKSTIYFHNFPSVFRRPYKYSHRPLEEAIRLVQCYAAKKN